MGDFLKEHDVHVESFANQLNLRFAPSQGLRTHHGGIEELAELQKEFKMFKKGRPLRTSMAVLNIGGTIGNDAKNKLYDYFDSLKKHGSNTKGLDGEAAIVDALVKNFNSKSLLPVYFKYHDMAGENGSDVVITRGRPVSYFNQDYVVLSFPTRAQGQGKPASGSAKKAGTASKSKPAAKKKSGKGK